MGKNKPKVRFKTCDMPGCGRQVTHRNLLTLDDEEMQVCDNCEIMIKRDPKAAAEAKRNMEKMEGMTEDEIEKARREDAGKLDVAPQTGWTVVRRIPKEKTRSGIILPDGDSKDRNDRFFVVRSAEKYVWSGVLLDSQLNEGDEIVLHPDAKPAANSDMLPEHYVVETGFCIGVLMPPPGQTN